MKRTDNEAEIRFAAKIDCRFPYRDRVMASAIIKEGWSISMDAAFGVLYEICLKPKSERVSRKRQHELIDEWAVDFDHPLKESMLRCARVLAEKQYLPWQEAVSVMEQIQQFEGEYSALNIACFAGDRDSVEGDAELEAAHERICKEWSEKRVSINGS